MADRIFITSPGKRGAVYMAEIFSAENFSPSLELPTQKRTSGSKSSGDLLCGRFPLEHARGAVTGYLAMF
jgi:hypothetical protein